MQVNIKGLINRLDDLRERLNKLFDKLEKLDDLDYDIAVEDVEQYFQNDDAFNLSIALDVLEQVDKLDKALEIINNKDIDIWLLKNCDYDNYCRIRKIALETNVESMVDSDEPAIPLPTKEEYDVLKEVLS